MSLPWSALTLRSAVVAVVGTAVMATASCGTATQSRPAAEPTTATSPSAAGTGTPSPDCGGFSLSLVSDRGGRPTPVAAAEWSAEHGGVPGVPRSGWQQDGEDESGTSVRSGDLTLHVVRGPDETWQVDSGSYC
jgi:hypothetical protein